MLVRSRGAGLLVGKGPNNAERDPTTNGLLLLFMEYMKLRMSCEATTVGGRSWWDLTIMP